MMRNLIFTCLWLLPAPMVFGQALKRSPTYIDTYYHGEKHFSIKEASEIFYSAGNHELTLLVDFSRLKTGVDSLDEWLLDLSDSKFVFKAFLPAGDLLTLTHHNLKSLEVEGVVTFNGKTHRQAAFISLYEISKEGMLFVDTGADDYDRIAANIQLAFFPRHFAVDRKRHHLKKKISIAIGRGAINKLP